MFSSTIKWHKLANSINELLWMKNNMCVMEVANKKITLVYFKNEIFAVAYKCPHAGGILCDGMVDATGNITCPLHRYKFNIANGRNTSGEGYYLTTYPIKSEADGIYIGLKEKNFF
jgi:nitrite reductase/ring-hydroxylating ferredoxin subunit